MTFYVDGKTVQDPSAEDIAMGFASIVDEGPRSISVIILQRSTITLCAFGNPKWGYTLDIREDVEPKGTQTSKVTSPRSPISHAEVIKLFQDFARGEDAWQSRYEWEPGIGEIPAARAFKRAALWMISFVLLVLGLKYVLKLF
jgi:hypothetical protein